MLSQGSSYFNDEDSPRNVQMMSTFNMYKQFNFIEKTTEVHRKNKKSGKDSYRSKHPKK